MKKEKVFFTSIYCPPYPPKGDYPSRITDNAYGMLHDVGIDNVFGHFEDMYGKEYLEQALECSDKAGITYYPRLNLFKKYLAVSGSDVYEGISYRFLSQSEKRNLKRICRRFRKMCKA